MIIMKIQNQVNPNYSLIKSFIEKEEAKELNVKSKKMDENSHGYIYPPVSQVITDYILKNNGRLKNCTEILAQDTILQEYQFKNNNGDNIHEDTLLKFWDKRNKYNLYLSVIERYQYGFGVCELSFNDDGTCVGLTQVPAKTMVIKKEESYDNSKYYAVQMNLGEPIKKFRLYNLLDNYDESDEEYNIVLWLGGGTTHRFYDIPAWYPDSDIVLGKINLNILNAQQIDNGNNIEGVLNITGPPQRPNRETGKTVEQQIREQMRSTGTGVMVSYLETPNKDFPLNFEFIKISNDNWQYLENFSKTADEVLMSNYNIPKVRLMIDDVTESMNSNKSDTIWQIYAISLNYEQFPNELIIQEFNNIFFHLNLEVDMQIPIFSDKRQIELTTVKDLFNTGLLTLGQAIVKISGFYPELRIDENISMDNPLLNERYYNGNLLGFNDGVTSSDVGEAELILDMFKNL
ncbi:hypothetical protein [Methanobrevibacter olleyae]|uniref:Phage portal protein n=1 Tax=Methanobrevibacter olleyae TaxID=294671 RepID=A0A126R3S4_METOL|nr:hypothetical protein [Methanobrevibacter olleyae]AMK16315.1 phage portal protein [Methanobrevibacter olleyae]